VPGHIQKCANDFEQIVKLCTLFKELEKGKGTDDHVQAMKAYMGSDLGTRWNMNGQLHAPVTYLRRKNPRYPLNRRLGGSLGGSGLLGEERFFFLPLTGITPESSR
jgi:hypothetical protein